MLSADQARLLMFDNGDRYRKRKIAKFLRKVNRKVKKAAKEGYTGVWLNWSNYSFRSDLQSQLQERLEDKGFKVFKNSRQFLVDWKEEEE